MVSWSCNHTAALNRELLLKSSLIKYVGSSTSLSWVYFWVLMVFVPPLTNFLANHLSGHVHTGKLLKWQWTISSQLSENRCTSHCSMIGTSHFHSLTESFWCCVAGADIEVSSVVWFGSVRFPPTNNSFVHEKHTDIDVFAGTKYHNE